MKTIPDVEIAAWLESLPLSPEGIDWDNGNEHKLGKHSVRKDDVEFILYGEGYVFAGKIVSPVHPEWRGLILGCDRSGRGLALIFTIRGRKLRPISCRRMRDEEKELYRENGPGRAEGPPH